MTDHPVVRRTTDLLKLLKIAEWEVGVFDAATLFTSVRHIRAGQYDRREFTTLFTAIADHQTDGRSVVYAVSPAGRAIVLDRRALPFWAARWATRQSHISEGVKMDTVFLLVWNGAGTKNTRVYHLPSRKAATDYVYAVVPGDQNTLIVEGDADLVPYAQMPETLRGLYNAVVRADGHPEEAIDRELTEFQLSVLPALHNRLGPEKPVARFADRTAGVRRVTELLPRAIIARLQTLQLPLIELAATPLRPPGRERSPAIKSGETPPNTARPARSKTVTTSTEAAVDKRIPGSAVIAAVGDTNPHREGTGAHENFKRYRVGQTVDEFVAKGGDRKLLWWNHKRGFIKLLFDAETPAEAAS